MAHNFFIFRNYTIEPLFDKIEGCGFSGYNDIEFPADFKYYVWFYLLPIRVNRATIAAEVDFFRKKLELVASNVTSSSILLCFTMTDPDPFSFVADDPVSEAIDTYNNFIFELANSNRNIKAMDFRSFTSKYSLRELVDSRHFYMSLVPINPKLAGDFSSWFEQKVNAVESIRKKCLVVDLDNTLWGGILGEDGITGITLGNTYPGNCYTDFQSFIREIKNTGVILAICSKNNTADVKQVFSNRDDMVLQFDDFSSTRINWKNKAENIVEIAQELNIGIDSMVFLDDSPFEREHVKTMLPEVVVPDFPKQPYFLVDFIKDVYNNWFQTYELTAEDTAKTEQYQQNTQRQKAIAQHHNMESFLKEMEIKLRISESNPVHIPRIAQMTQKTNQFNLTTKRYTEREIKNMLKKGYIVWDASVSDKFGDNGITALAILKVEGTTALIDSFLLSCRILGRGIETAFLNHILNHLFDEGFRTIVATFIPTEKNMQVESFYDNTGFNCVSADNTRTKVYKLELTEKLRSSELFGITLG
ncbi:MAG: HAD-IIIC family phosphatase [Bacteroidetes bacterium]|nr:HAD-IIIC family phosphatase [Bacteroidota bacterium]MBL6943411.1 HAD family hydrolase [Bacteroidales bacterium]